jgi:hypothetical protein
MGMILFIMVVVEGSTKSDKPTGEPQYTWVLVKLGKQLSLEKEARCSVNECSYSYIHFIRAQHVGSWPFPSWFRDPTSVN